MVDLYGCTIGIVFSNAESGGLISIKFNSNA